MITLKCYEPPGQVLQLDRETLSKFVMVLGSTGSGKTTAVIDPCVEQLIAQPGVGLLVLDPKGDDTPDRIRHYAARHGRSDDVVVLCPNSGTTYYNAFEGLRSLEQVEEYARRMMSGTEDMGSRNAYWQEMRQGMTGSLLTLALASGEPVTIERVASLGQAWWLQEKRDLVANLCKLPRRLLAEGNLSPSTKARLEGALVDVDMWWSMHSNTRENHKSTLSNMLRPLSSAAARLLLTAQVHSRPWKAADILQGKIMVASINAQTHPGLTRMLFKMLKRDFFSVIQDRRAVDLHRDPFAVLVVDEFPLSVETTDIEQLATLRSRGCGILAASQSLASLRNTLDQRLTELTANFNSYFFLRSQDPAVDVLAAHTMGQIEVKATIDERWGGVSIVRKISLWPKPVCPVGSLGRLPSHHAYVSLADGTRPEGPVWLEPKFLPIAAPARMHSTPNELELAIARLRATPVAAPKVTSSLCPKGVQAKAIREIMLRAGKLTYLPPRVVAAAWQLCQPGRLPQSLQLGTKALRGIHGGLDLPACWQRGLAGWLQQAENIMEVIEEVGIIDGMLYVKCRDDHYAPAKTALRHAVGLNLRLYPSQWRPLRPSHFFRLDPHLRQQLNNLAAARNAQAARCQRAE